jgi:coatomer subunit beta'
LPLTLIEYQTAVLRGDFAHAQQILPSVPQDQHNRIARFLESQGQVELALEITVDPEHRFELAMQLGRLEICYKLALELDHEHKWKLIGDTALANWNFGLALEAWKRGNDLESLFLLYQTSGNAQGLEDLANLAQSKGDNNIAFSSFFLLGKMEPCLDILVATEKLPEAAFFARTHIPSRIGSVVTLWKESLVKQGKPKAAETLVSPEDSPQTFPDLPYAIAAQMYRDATRERGLEPAASYPTRVSQSLCEELKGRFKPENAIPAIQELIKKQMVGAVVSKPIAKSRDASPTRAPQSPIRQHEEVHHKQAVVTPNRAPVSSTNSPASPPKAAQTPTTPSGAQNHKIAKADAQSPVTAIEPKVMSVNQQQFALLDEPDISDNISHMSLEVNTTGTGSARGDLDTPINTMLNVEELPPRAEEFEGFEDFGDAEAPPDIDEDEIDALLA